MKIALFAAVPEEVGTLNEHFHFTGIGRENATRAMVAFMDKHRDEDFVIVNAGTVGSHNKAVGSLLSIREITSAGAPFNVEPMLLERFNLEVDKRAGVEQAVLYSSDSFVSPAVFTQEYLNSIMQKADCFDMEASALYAVASFYGKRYVSYKVVSDNLDVSIAIWQQRVAELSKKIVAHLQQVFKEIEENEGLEILM